MLVKTAHNNFLIKKFNEKHLQRGECCAAHSTTDDSNSLAVNTFDLKINLWFQPALKHLMDHPTKLQWLDLKTRVASDHLRHAAAISIHNQVLTGSVALEHHTVTCEIKQNIKKGET